MQASSMPKLGDGKNAFLSKREKEGGKDTQCGNLMHIQSFILFINFSRVQFSKNHKLFIYVIGIVVSNLDT